MVNGTKHGRSNVIKRRPAEALTGTAALAAAIGLFAAEEKAAALAGLVGLIPAVITFVVDKLGNAAGRSREREYAPALDSMYSHLSSAVGSVLEAVIDARQPKRSLATIDRVAGVIGRLDPRLTQDGAIAAGWPVGEELPEAEEPEPVAEAPDLTAEEAEPEFDGLEPEAESDMGLPEAEGGVALEDREPKPRRRRRAAGPARPRAGRVTA
jgi:hypothetical protein